MLVLMSSLSDKSPSPVAVVQWHFFLIAFSPLYAQSSVSQYITATAFSFTAICSLFWPFR